MKRAFTLIELLVVIAIIAILAAILFPVFAQAKVAAKKASDLSNQKQIATGVLMYSTDADDCFPRSVYFRINGDPNTQYLWRAAVQPYIKSGQNGDNGYAGGGGIWLSPGQPTGAGGTGASYLIHGRISPSDVADWGASLNTTNPKSNVSQTNIDNIAGKLLMTTVGTPYGGFPASNMMQGWWFWSGEMGRYNPTTKRCENLYSTWPPAITGPQAGFRCYNVDGPDPVGNRDWLSGSMPRFRFNDGANAAYTDGHAKYGTAPQFNWCTQIAIGGLNRFDSDDPNSDDFDVARRFKPGDVCQAFIGQQ